MLKLELLKKIFDIDILVFVAGIKPDHSDHESNFKRTIHN